MTTRRAKPYMFATWMSKVLVGSNHCNWAVWHRTHFDFRKREFDSTRDMIKHTAIKRDAEKELIHMGYKVYHEVWFKVEGQHLDFAGRCDLVGIKDGGGVICEVKSGKKHDSDRAQLLLYMWALPKAAAAGFKGVMFDGLLAYETKREIIPAIEVDEVFCQILGDYIIDILKHEPGQRHPSFFECKFCNIAACDERQTEPDPP